MESHVHNLYSLRPPSMHPIGNHVHEVGGVLLNGGDGVFEEEILVRLVFHPEGEFDNVQVVEDGVADMDLEMAGAVDEGGAVGEHGS